MKMPPTYLLRKYANAYKKGLAAINKIAVPIQNLKYGEKLPSISMPSLG